MKLRLKIDVIENGTEILDESEPEKMQFEIAVGENMIYMAKELGVDVKTLAEIVGKAMKEFYEIAMGENDE
jgi:hypothetical protein